MCNGELRRVLMNPFALSTTIRVTYAGSYKLQLTKGGLFRNDKGTFSRIDTPQASGSFSNGLQRSLPQAAGVQMGTRG